MKGDGGSITVTNNDGLSMVVSITQSGGGTPTAYTDGDLSSTHAMPKTITSTTTFWFAEPNDYTVSVTVNGQEVASDDDETVTVRLGSRRGFSLEPTVSAATLADLALNGAGGGLPQHYIEINPFMTPTAHVGWNTVTAAASYIMGGYMQSSTALNDEISWAVSVDAGTWALELMHATTTDAGIITATLDGVELGTVDTYSASLTRNVKSMLAGISVATAGTKTLKLKMAGKNASSTNYRGYLQWVTLRRTGA